MAAPTPQPQPWHAQYRPEQRQNVISKILAKLVEMRPNEDEQRLKASADKLESHCYYTSNTMEMYIASINRVLADAEKKYGAAAAAAAAAANPQLLAHLRGQQAQAQMQQGLARPVQQMMLNQQQQMAAIQQQAQVQAQAQVQQAQAQAQQAQAQAQAQQQQLQQQMALRMQQQQQLAQRVAVANAAQAMGASVVSYRLRLNRPLPNKQLSSKCAGLHRVLQSLQPLSPACNKHSCSKGYSNKHRLRFRHNCSISSNNNNSNNNSNSNKTRSLHKCLSLQLPLSSFINKIFLRYADM
eukprot:tig00020903_g15112.t1